MLGDRLTCASSGNGYIHLRDIAEKITSERRAPARLLTGPTERPAEPVEAELEQMKEEPRPRPDRLIQPPHSGFGHSPTRTVKFWLLVYAAHQQQPILFMLP